jgi:hypothetical protein
VARYRTIKPEFWCSEQVAECSPNARLLFVGLWNFADDGGIHPASLKQLKMEVFPGDPFSLDDIAAWITELRNVGLLAQYESQGKAWWGVTGWHHQKIDKPTFKYPPLEIDDGSPTVRRPFDDGSPLKGVESKGIEKKGVESKGAEGKGTNNAAAAAVESVCRHYQTLHERAKPGPKERKLISARLQEGYSPEDLISAINGCHKTPHNLGANERNTKYLGLALIMRDSSQVTRFIEADEHPPQARSEKEQRSLFAGEAFLRRIQGDAQQTDNPAR